MRKSIWSTATAVAVAVVCVTVGKGLQSDSGTAGHALEGTTEYPDIGLEHIGPRAPATWAGAEAIVTDPVEPFAYFAVSGDVMSIVKMSLPELQPADHILIEEAGTASRAAVLDPSRRVVYFGFNSTPKKIIGIDLETFTVLAEIDVEQEGKLQAAVLDAKRGEVTFFTNSVPPHAITLNVADGSLRRDTAVPAWNHGVLEDALLKPLTDRTFFLSTAETSYRTGYLHEFALSNLERIKTVEYPGESMIAIAQETVDGNLVVGSSLNNNESWRLRTLSGATLQEIRKSFITGPITSLASDSVNQVAYVGNRGVIRSYRLRDLRQESGFSTGAHYPRLPLAYDSNIDGLVWADYRAGVRLTSGESFITRFNKVLSIIFLFVQDGYIYSRTSGIYKFVAETGAFVERFQAPDVGKWMCAVHLPGTNIAFVGTDDVPAKVHKVNIDTFEILETIELHIEENKLRVALYDPLRNVVYFAGLSSLARVVKIDVASFKRTDVVRLDRYEENITSGFIDDNSRYAYFATHTSPGNFIRIDLDSFARAGSIVLDSAPAASLSAHYDPIDKKGYIFHQNGLTKVDLPGFRWEDSHSESLLTYAAIDPIGRSLYFGTETSYIHKLNLDDFSHVGARHQWEESGPSFGLLFDEDTATLHQGSVQTVSKLRTVAYRVAHKNSLNASPFELAETAYVNDMRFYSHAAGGNLRFALYADGEERELLWESGAVANTATEGTVVVPISNGTPSSLVLEPGSYYLAWQSDTTLDVPSHTETEGAGLRLRMPFGPAPAVLADAKEVNSIWTQFITYTTDPPPTPTPTATPAPTATASPTPTPSPSPSPSSSPSVTPTAEPTATPTVTPSPTPVEEPTELAGLFSNWFFAEGAAYPGLDTFYLVANPHAVALELEVELLLENGNNQVLEMAVEAEGRLTIRGNDYVSNTGVSAIIREKNGRTFAAERAVYTIGEGSRWYGAHAAAGIPQLHSEWFLAEGATSQAGPAESPFETYVLVANPNAVDVTVLLTFFLQADEAPVEAEFTVPAMRRLTVSTNHLHERLDQRSFSTRVRSKNGEPIAVERAMWWRASNWEHGGFMEGNASPGIASLSTSWYLAEGNTAEDEFILLANPGNSDANVTIRYLLEDDAPVVRELTIPAQRRRTINVRHDAEGIGRVVRHGTEITSTSPIAIERSQYFSGGDYGWVGGHHSVASSEAATHWVLPEGAEVPITASRLTTEFLVANPGGLDALVELRFLLGDGNASLKPLPFPRAAGPRSAPAR